MSYREADVRISQAILTIAHELNGAMGYVHRYQREGKLTEDEENDYREKIQALFQKMTDDLAKPIRKRHPDLLPPFDDIEEDCHGICDGCADKDPHD